MNLITSFEAGLKEEEGDDGNEGMREMVVETEHRIMIKVNS